MGSPLDLVGQRYGSLTVIGVARTNKNERGWLCRCDCGQTTTVRTGALRNGNTGSCGCVKRTVLGKSTTKHGLHGTALYETWKSMRARCLTKTHKRYRYYGGKGVCIYSEWDDFQKYRDYVLKELGPRPSPKHSIDRIKNDGNYEPGNIRWATQEVQINNNSRVLWLTYNNKTLTLAQWARELGLSRACLYSRLYTYNWPIEKALTKS